MRSEDLAKLSFRAMMAHKFRSLLTALGIMVGMAAVVLLTSIGEGVHQFVLAEFTQFGTNLIAVAPGKSSTFGMSGAAISNVRPLTIEDGEGLLKAEGVIAAVPVVQGNASVEFGSRSRRVNVLGVNHAVPDVWKMAVGSGRFLPADDQRAARPFAVLGSKLRNELFAGENPLGRRVRIGGDRYRVIGVMEDKGQMLGFDLDDAVYIPAGRALELFNRESLMEIDLLYESGLESEGVAKSVKRLLISRHGHEDFTLITQEQMLEVLGSILSVLTLAVSALGGVSLLVGAIGILTIMTIAVSERVSEIGLLRAIGAEQNQVLKLFLGEAVVLSTVGGCLGVFVGVSLVELLRWVAPDLPVEIAWRYLAAGLVLSIFIGLFAGVVPAIRAARLRPLEALRAE